MPFYFNLKICFINTVKIEQLITKNKKFTHNRMVQYYQFNGPS